MKKRYFALKNQNILIDKKCFWNKEKEEDPVCSENQSKIQMNIRKNSISKAQLRFMYQNTVNHTFKQLPQHQKQKYGTLFDQHNMHDEIAQQHYWSSQHCNFVACKLRINDYTKWICLSSVLLHFDLMLQLFVSNWNP